MSANIQIMDGAIGTELMRHGVACPPPLWSTAGLFYPETLKNIYRDYLEAGATCLTTNTFRTGWGDIISGGLPEGQFEVLNQLALDLVQDVIQERGQEGSRPITVLGSISSIADCYHPEDLSSDPQSWQEIHRKQMQLFLDSKKVDVLLCETLGGFGEIKVIVKLWREEFKLHIPLWLSILCRDPTRLLDGTPLKDLWHTLGEATWPTALGFNCVSPGLITLLIEGHRKQISPHAQLLAYGHLGRENKVGQWVHEDVMTPLEYARVAERWVELGVTIVGGCCGTTPEYIQVIAQKITT